MKLRIRGNSVRVRVSQGEAAALGAGQKVQQVTEFPGGRKLISCVEPCTAVRELSCEFVDGLVRICVPLATAKAWAGSEAVSLEGGQPLSSGQLLSILIEKDFECMHSAAEENADAFPNPGR